MSRESAVGLRYLELAYRVRRSVDEHLSADGMSLARLKLLQAIDRLEPVNQTGLAGELGLAARSVTQAVEALERDGLVRRAASPADRRAKLVSLTPAGAAAAEAGAAAGERALRRIFQVLDAGQRTALAELLDVVEAGLATDEAAGKN
ncbi:MarR family transcriptional regulator [Amycolatopsis sp. NPDC051102]|uniref:MarR family winged helix-turn-helix transcriptional regulator n=1 Tax=Amycolatopsis sp. NPDC051102 TaxID=3155163 RepID=UPI003412D6E9